MDGYIICPNCDSEADYMHAGHDDFGRYRFYECANCGAGHNVYDMTEQEAAYDALVEDALRAKDRGVVIDDDDAFLAWYDDRFDDLFRK